MCVDVNGRCVCNMHLLCPNELAVPWHHNAQHLKWNLEGTLGAQFRD